jgi:hypothetical protein
VEGPVDLHIDHINLAQRNIGSPDRKVFETGLCSGPLLHLAAYEARQSPGWRSGTLLG